MKRNLMIGICMVVGMALAAEARDWGFSKDTVYEWKPGGDTVWLANSSADTLRLDSLFVEDVAPSDWIDMSFLFGMVLQDSPDRDYRAYTLYQFPRTVIKMDEASVPPNDSVPLRAFDVWKTCIVKRGVTFSSEPDDFVVRLKFRSWENEEDTLIVKGHYCIPNAIIPHGVLKLNESFEVGDRDLNGRRVLPPRNFPALRR